MVHTHGGEPRPLPTVAVLPGRLSPTGGPQTSSHSGRPSWGTVTHGGTPDLCMVAILPGRLSPMGGPQTSSHSGRPSWVTVTHGETPDLCPRWLSIPGDCRVLERVDGKPVGAVGLV